MPKLSEVLSREFQVKYRCARCGADWLGEVVQAYGHDDALRECTQAVSHPCPETDGRGVRGVALPHEVSPC